MNMKRAHNVVSILQSYNEISAPVMLFVYGDFAKSYPEVIEKWATRFDVGVREDGPYPLGHFALLQPNWVRESLSSAELRLQEIGIQPAYYLPVVNVTKPSQTLRGPEGSGWLSQMSCFRQKMVSKRTLE